jgi:hypothetical protein
MAAQVPQTASREHQLHAQAAVVVVLSVFLVQEAQVVEVQGQEITQRQPQEPQTLAVAAAAAGLQVNRAVQVVQAAAA